MSPPNLLVGHRVASILLNSYPLRDFLLTDQMRSRPVSG